MIDGGTFVLFIKLAVALLCGAAIGTERVISHKAAGMRTYALVSMGAALFVIVSDMLIKQYVSAGVGLSDPLQIPSMIISGIGFMGVGLIISRDKNVTGLTTASGLWVTAGIGMACGAGFYMLSLIATLLALFVLIILWHVEKHIKSTVVYEDDPTESKL